MGFISTVGHLFLRRVPRSYWKVNNLEITRDLKLMLNLDPLYLDGYSDYEIQEDIKLLYGTATDLSERLYQLFEGGLDLKLKKLPPLSKQHIINYTGSCKDVTNDNDDIYILCGGFGLTYPGSIYGGSRYNQTKDLFSFIMELTSLRQFPVYHIFVIFNEINSKNLERLSVIEFYDGIKNVI